MCLYCKQRSKSDIEDEKHILLRCPRYDIYRNELFAYVDELCPRFKELNGFEKFNYLLNSDGPIVKTVARFFYKANTTNKSERKHLIYVLCSLSFSSLSLSFSLSLGVDILFVNVSCMF